MPGNWPDSFIAEGGRL